MANRIQCR